MIEKTGQIYEEFRHETLSQQGLKEVLMESDEDFQEKFDKIKKDWLVSAQKEEDEMKKVFKKKVETKEEEFKKKEADVSFLFFLFIYLSFFFLFLSFFCL